MICYHARYTYVKVTMVIYGETKQQKKKIEFKFTYVMFDDGCFFASDVVSSLT